MKMWYNGQNVEVKVGQKVTVFRVGCGRTIFGEAATLTRFTKQHAVFTTESGAIVKTAADNLHRTVGKAKEDGWAISLAAPEKYPNLIHKDVWFWDSKACKLVKK